jgi:hypothetical protein
MAMACLSGEPFPGTQGCERHLRGAVKAVQESSYLPKMLPYGRCRQASFLLQIGRVLLHQPLEPRTHEPGR